MILKLLVPSLPNLSYWIRGKKCAHWARVLGNTWGVTIARAGDSARANRERGGCGWPADSVLRRGIETDVHQRLIDGTEEMGEREEKVRRGNSPRVEQG